MGLTALRALISDLITQTGGRQTPTLGAQAIAEISAYPSAVTAALAPATNQRTITATVTGSDGAPLEGAPVVLTARATGSLFSLMVTANHGTRDATTITGTEVVIRGRTDEQGRFEVVLQLVGLTLTGDVTAACGHLAVACDGA